MSTHSSILDQILSSKIVAVIRGNDASQLEEVCLALIEGGVTNLEVTFTVPNAHRALESLRSKIGNRAILGAGTVLDAETARIAILAGAQFVVGPNTNLGVIELCRRYSIPVFPGALTPTEIVHAWQAGADIVKVFPSDAGGPSYLKAIRGPLPQIRLMPTGGVTLDTAQSFLDAGAVALGVGGALVSQSLVESRNFDELKQRAQRFTAFACQDA